ncbi:MAG TPA: L,D-transpeptidase family protein [Clostridia bacterium]|nr:L,D-transpeptidase family protein [Clostridia bacterium]
MFPLKKKKLIKLTVLTLVFVFCTAVLGSVGQGPAYAAAQPYVKYVIQPGDSLYKISRAYGLTIESLKAANGLSSDMIIAGNAMNIPITQASTQSMALKDIIGMRGLAASQLNIRLFADKSDKLLTVYNGNTPLKAYHVELGDGGPGDKQIAGDHKTPEGSFYITQKLVLDPADQYLGTRWMRLSYPNIEDAQRGLKSGIISNATYNQIVNAINNGLTPPQNTALGGGVGIHGGSTTALGTNWTFGCVGLTNKDVQDFYDYIKVGTKVTIQP